MASEGDSWEEFERGPLDFLELSSWVANVLPESFLVCPVAGPVEFTDTWEEERAWGRTHKGTDMDSDRGTPLVAIERGTIVQTGWNWAGGFGVFLYGARTSDVYYYSHLQWINPSITRGVEVEAGDLLGWVGSTGNASSPHLHFGWMPDHGWGWIELDLLRNPYQLLERLCG
jgi:murein DD-endopeptidase MepM/ murein hydrolase activator NlpD